MRVALGVTRRELSKFADVSTTHIRTIERGANNPRTETLRKIADALDVQMFQLLSPPESVVIVERSGLEMLVMIAVENEKITLSRGAEIMGMGVVEFRKWFNQKMEETP